MAKLKRLDMTVWQGLVLRTFMQKGVEACFLLGHHEGRVWQTLRRLATRGYLRVRPWPCNDYAVAEKARRTFPEWVLKEKHADQEGDG